GAAAALLLPLALLATALLRGRGLGSRRRRCLRLGLGLGRLLRGEGRPVAARVAGGLAGLPRGGGRLRHCLRLGDLPRPPNVGSGPAPSPLPGARPRDRGPGAPRAPAARPCAVLASSPSSSPPGDPRLTSLLVRGVATAPAAVLAQLDSIRGVPARLVRL